MYTRADLGWIDVEEDERYIMDDYGYPVWVPFSAPVWAGADFEVI